MDFHGFPAGVFVSHFDSLRPIDWPRQFGDRKPLHLEIGFGQGEFLIQQAGCSVNENWIGIEQDWSRLCKSLSRIALEKASSGDPNFGTNIRLLRLDVTVALRRLFVPQSISQVTCLFPCPWPKKGHVKHRLFSQDFLLLLNSRLKPQAQIRIVTDWKPYGDWVNEQIAQTGFSVKRVMITPQFNTKFERKWKADGHDKFWQLLLTKEQDHPYPVIEDIAMRVHFVKEFNPATFRFENIVGEESVIYKDFVFDQLQNVGLVRLVVSEKFLTQHVWVSIIKTKNQWCIAKADGHSALPTSGVALAIEQVFRAAEKTKEQRT